MLIFPRRYLSDALLTLLAPDGVAGGAAPAQTEGVNDDETSEPADGQQKPAPAQITMTQADFEARLQARLARQLKTIETQLGGKPADIKKRMDEAVKAADDLKRQSMSDQQRAIEDAKAQGRTDAEQEYGQRVTVAETAARVNGIRAEIALTCAGQFKPDLVKMAVDTIARDERAVYDPATNTVAGIDEIVAELRTNTPSLFVEQGGDAQQTTGTTPRPSNAAPRVGGARSGGAQQTTKALADAHVKNTYPGMPARSTG